MTENRLIEVVLYNTNEEKSCALCTYHSLPVSKELKGSTEESKDLRKEKRSQRRAKISEESKDLSKEGSRKKLHSRKQCEGEKVV